MPAGEHLPRPGRLSVYRDESDAYVLRLPKAARGVNARIVYLEVDVFGTKTVLASPADCVAKCPVLPSNTRVAAFVVDETEQGERSQGGPVLYFWTDED